MNLDQFIARWNGKFCDVDGSYGAQCWDSWSRYAMDVVGVPYSRTNTRAGASLPHGGYACNVWHNAEAAGLTQWFVKLPANATPQRGDVVFWEYGTSPHTSSHVAIVLENRGDYLYVLQQNAPGLRDPTNLSNARKSGLLGYLRPKNAPTEPPTTPEPEKGFTLPALIRTPDGTIGFVGDNGELTPLTSMTEVESLQATGIVGPYVDLPDRLVWNTLTAITARKIAERK
ncbi:CHAP domain-containing protein [Lysinibacter sp. HNR]|uniref:CHAP domain-containing protein n=1 Tax=Lysinibacter sp. HNR TaxID=3031408 RepID=UPI002435D902|nr:CHAP domain-containing protein [Lysinibacter sp. HNR]WGD37420.1 CHAP domain-containing protein [Lysinibacter sp. HNR]